MEADAWPPSSDGSGYAPPASPRRQARGTGYKAQGPGKPTAGKLQQAPRVDLSYPTSGKQLHALLLIERLKNEGTPPSPNARPKPSSRADSSPSMSKTGSQSDVHSCPTRHQQQHQNHQQSRAKHLHSASMGNAATGSRYNPTTPTTRTQSFNQESSCPSSPSSPGVQRHSRHQSDNSPGWQGEWPGAPSPRHHGRLSQLNTSRVGDPQDDNPGYYYNPDSPCYSPRPGCFSPKPGCYSPKPGCHSPNPGFVSPVNGPRRDQGWAGGESHPPQLLPSSRSVSKAGSSGGFSMPGGQRTPSPDVPVPCSPRIPTRLALALHNDKLSSDQKTNAKKIPSSTDSAPSPRPNPPVPFAAPPMPPLFPVPLPSPLPPPAPGARGMEQPRMRCSQSWAEGQSETAYPSNQEPTRPGSLPRVAQGTEPEGQGCGDMGGGEDEEELENDALGKAELVMKGREETPKSQDRAKASGQAAQRIFQEMEEKNVAPRGMEALAAWGLEKLSKGISAALPILDKASTASILLPHPKRVEDEYTLGNVLGKGQFGTIRLAQKEDGQQSACKSISKSSLKTKQDVEDIKRECTVLRMLKFQSNVCHLEDIFEDAENVHLVMELCSGGDLFERLKERKAYSEAEAALVLKAVLEVLQSCHERSIVHRDIKPENILLESRDSHTDIRVADFGIAVLMNQGGKPLTEVKGSLTYMAPEVTQGSYGCAADIWSAGVTLYALLTGAAPFWADTEVGLIRSIREKSLKFSKSTQLSASARDLLVKMLAKDPIQRLTATEALRHPWITTPISA